MPTAEELRIAALGAPRFASPLALSRVKGDGLGNFVEDDEAILFELLARRDESPAGRLLLERAGPREKLFFEPAKTRAAIVTCGGLCPGINNVIRSIFLELRHNYGVSSVLGIRYGFQGLNPAAARPPIELTPEFVESIHKHGGTVLGTSRGAQPIPAMVEFLHSRRIDVLFCIGGDGTIRGAAALHEEIARRQLPISVVCVPKTIDNDIPYVARTFGYFTALEEAQQVLRAAHVEARAAARGIALVKLMGRAAGFIAAGASLASQEVNCVLIPEVRFPLAGDDGLLAWLGRRLADRDHAVIVVAEGAGQHLFSTAPCARDPSGNVKHHDVGERLRECILEHFAAVGEPATIKYFDPSYSIRSVPANCADSILCDQLGRDAVHAGMAGKTAMLVSLWHDALVHLPLALVAGEPRQIDVEGELWTNVLLSTGQPRWR